MKITLLNLTMIMVVFGGIYAADNASPKTPTGANAMQSEKIKLKVRDKVVTATLIDSPTTRDFISLLPLTVKMNDLFGREKYGPLPRTISQEGKRSKTYEVGSIGYWSPGNEVAIYYKNDGEQIPAPGIILIGKIDSGEEVFNVPGSLEVTMELGGK